MSVAVTANATRSRRKRRRVVEPDRVAPAFRDSGLPHASPGNSARNRQHGIILHQDVLTEHKPFAIQHLDFRTTRLDTDIDALLNQALPDPLTSHDDPDAISIRNLKQLIARHRALLAARLLVAKRRRELDVERVRRVTIAERENIWVRHLSKRFDLRADMISEVGERIQFVAKGMTCAQVPDDWSEDDYDTNNNDRPVNIGEQYHQVPSVDWRDEPVTKGLSIDEISDDVALIRSGKRQEQVIPQSPDLKLINEEDRILGDPPSQWSAKIEADNDHHQQQTDDPDKLSLPEMDSPPKQDVPAPQQTQGSPSYQHETAPDYPYPRHPGHSEPPPNNAQDPNAPPPPTPQYNYGYSQSYIQPPPPAYPLPPQQRPSYSPEYDYRQDPHLEPRYMPMHQEPYVQAQPQRPQYYHSHSLHYPHQPQMTPQDQPSYPPPLQQRQRQDPLLLPPPPPPPPTHQQEQGWHQQPSPPPQRYQSQYPSQQQQRQQQPPPTPPPQQPYPPHQYGQCTYPRSQQPSHDSAPPPPDYRQYYHPSQDYTFAPQQNYASPQNGQYGEHHYQHAYNPPAPYSAQSTEYQYNAPYQPQYSYPPPPPPGPPPPPHQGQRALGEQYHYSHQQEYQYQHLYSHGGAQPAGYPPASYQHRNPNSAPPMYTTASQSTSTGPVLVKDEPGTASTPIVIHNGEQDYMPESRREIIAGGQSRREYDYSPDQQARHHDRWLTYPSGQSQQQQQYGGDPPRYEYSRPPEWSGPPGPTYQNYGPPPSGYGPPGSHYGEQYSHGTPNRLSRPSRP